MSSRTRKMASWVTTNAWLVKALSDYKELRPLRILVTANFDESAVSDGTAGCHFKDEAFVYASNAEREKLGGLLDTALQNIDLCDGIAAHVHDEAYQLSDKAEMTFNYILKVLEDARAATDEDTLDLLADCIALRDGDDWVRTPYGKAIVVRNRRPVAGKNEKEATIQTRLISGAEQRHLDTDAGYDGQLGKFIRRSNRTKDHLRIIHFAAMTLDSLHNSHNTSKITRFMVTRILLKGSGTSATTFYKRTYALYFRNVNGDLVHIEKPTVVEELEVGQIFEGESKFFVDQSGDGLCSKDTEAWLDYIKKNATLLVLIYAFNHTAYPGIEYTHDDTRKLLEDICERKAAHFTREEADQLLLRFDLRGGATNPALVDLCAAAMLERFGFGTGTAKYIETIYESLAFREAAERVGINFHHILTGTWDQVDKRVAAINKAHQNPPAEGFGIRYIVAGLYAIPIRVSKYFDGALEVAMDNKGEISVAEALNLSQIGSLDYYVR